MSERRYCVNCIHSRRHFLFGMKFAACEAPQNKTISLSTGREKYKYSQFCEVQRAFGSVGFCGPAGQWFEQKQPSKLRKWFLDLTAS